MELDCGAVVVGVGRSRLQNGIRNSEFGAPDVICPLRSQSCLVLIESESHHVSTRRRWGRERSHDREVGGVTFNAGSNKPCPVIKVDGVYRLLKVKGIRKHTAVA